MNKKDFDALWKQVLEVWNHGFMGVDVGSIIIALVIFFGFMLFRGLFGKYILGWLRRWAHRTDNKVDDNIIDALIPPIHFVPVILGFFFAGQYLKLDGVLADFFSQMTRSMIAFTIFWSLHRALDPISKMSKKLKKALTPPMMSWAFKVLKVLVIFIGGAVVLEIWGIAVGPLLAGLGLFGAAVALGAQDLFKNLIGGITVIAEKRFAVGDWILVDGVVEGHVEDIGFRSTKIRRFDKAPVHVPNANLSDAAVTNFSRMSYRRIRWMIGVTYDTSIEQLKIIRDEIMKEIETNNTFAKGSDVATSVRVDAFGESSIDFLVNCFTKSIDLDPWLAAKEELALKIKEIVEIKAGAKFAFPSQSLYVEQWPGDGAERFTPPLHKATAKKGR